MSAYYNEIDLYAAEWLRNLIKAGHIADGEVDTRSIVDVQPDDLKQFTQCHFFAGIAGWSHALRLAGWSDERKIWTGSCPCQPFSVAGQGKGVNDERHLWPHFFRLIRGCRPPVVMGEQVAGAAGYGWLDGVRSDLEGESYAIEGVDIPACSANAPHIRQRLYWVAHSKHTRWNAERLRGYGEAGLSMGEGQASSIVRSGEDGTQCMDNAMRGRHGDADKKVFTGRDGFVDASGVHSDMADAESSRRQHGILESRDGYEGNESEWRGNQFADNCISDMADAKNGGRQFVEVQRSASELVKGNISPQQREQFSDDYTSALRRESSFWHNAIWLNGADGKTRRAKPGVCLLAHGVPARVGKLRAYGNAIVPPLAAEVIKAFMES
jgi:DNA (cytosine-5)-methyltransferase 1